jgi:hypothetical protein
MLDRNQYKGLESFDTSVRLPRVMVAYCEHVAQLTGIEMF